MHAFIDESERGPYLLGAVVVAPGQLSELRRVLRGLRKPGERRIHFHEESPSFRRSLLAEFAATKLVRAWIYISKARRNDVARSRCLTSMLSDLAGIRCTRMVIESREGRDRQDKQTIVQCRYKLPALKPLTYEHMRPYEEPLLWPADGIIWAYGAGKDWKRRVLPMIEKLVDADGV